MSDKPIEIAERWKDRHGLLKLWTGAGKHPKTEHCTFEFAKNIVTLIEELSRAEEHVRQLREVLEDADDTLANFGIKETMLGRRGIRKALASTEPKEKS
jgi:hypothetical protein